METLLFFHHGMTQRTRLTTALIAFAVTFLIAGFVTLRRLPRGALWFAGVASLVWIATGASLAADLSDDTRRGVIVGGEVVGRKGPDARGYEPSFTAPLPPGVEFELLETRGRWVYVRLRDGRTTWLPTGSVISWIRWPPARATALRLDRRQPPQVRDDVQLVDDLHAQQRLDRVLERDDAHVGPVLVDHEGDMLPRVDELTEERRDGRRLRDHGQRLDQLGDGRIQIAPRRFLEQLPAQREPADIILGFAVDRGCASSGSAGAYP